MEKQTRLNYAIGGGLIAFVAIAAALDGKSRSDINLAAVERVKASTYAVSSYNGICDNARPDDTNYGDQSLSTDGVYCGRKQAILTVAVKDGDRTKYVYVVADAKTPERAKPTITPSFKDAYGF